MIKRHGQSYERKPRQFFGEEAEEEDILFECPGCGAEIDMDSPESVCEYCGRPWD